MEKVKDKVTLYVVCYEDYIDPIIKQYVERYAELNHKVSVKTVDPAVRPGFIGEYTDETLDASATNLIVVNEANKRARVIHYSDIYYQQYSEYELYYFYMSYGYYPENPTYFNLEDELASAIHYVTMEHLPTIYYTTGHEEREPDEYWQYYTNATNIKLTPLALDQVDRVPADANALLIDSPKKDFTEAERELLEDYAEKGGTVILSSSYDSKRDDRSLPNLHGFAASYGLTYHDALICEGDGAHHPKDHPEKIYAQLCKKYADLFSSGKVMLEASHAITVNAPEGVTVTELLTTTDKGYAKASLGEDGTYEKEEGDVKGKYVLGALAQKKEGAATSQLYWFASSTVLDMAGTAQLYANPYIALSLMAELCEAEDAVSIAAKALQVEALSVSADSANLWGIILIGVVPVATLLIGFVVWRRRVKQ